MHTSILQSPFAENGFVFLCRQNGSSKLFAVLFFFLPISPFRFLFVLCTPYGLHLHCICICIVSYKYLLFLVVNPCSPLFVYPCSSLCRPCSYPCRLHVISMSSPCRPLLLLMSSCRFQLCWHQSGAANAVHAVNKKKIQMQVDPYSVRVRKLSLPEKS